MCFVDVGDVLAHFFVWELVGTMGHGFTQLAPCARPCRDCMMMHMRHVILEAVPKHKLFFTRHGWVARDGDLGKVAVRLGAPRTLVLLYALTS